MSRLRWCGLKVKFLCPRSHSMHVAVWNLGSLSSYLLSGCPGSLMHLPGMYSPMTLLTPAVKPQGAYSVSGLS